MFYFQEMKKPFVLTSHRYSYKKFHLVIFWMIFHPRFLVYNGKVMKWNSNKKYHFQTKPFNTFFQLFNSFQMLSLKAQVFLYIFSTCRTIMMTFTENILQCVYIYYAELHQVSSFWYSQLRNISGSFEKSKNQNYQTVTVKNLFSTAFNLEKNFHVYNYSKMLY